MKLLTIMTIFLASSLISQELKIKANQFDADEKTGISIFQGKVNIIKGNDELNASKVTVHTDAKHQPTKYIAEGEVSFNIETKKGSLYQGVAGKVIYMPTIKEYHFFTDVHLKQIDEKKEIIGDEVVLKTIEGKAYARGAKKEPVIMIFKMVEEKE
ncbi:putative cell envelope biogenesis protein [Sulfurimonas gotlandica GD1]|jgi:lipopolysaccharide export system protein LptA|uniref:Putative cell envelope biogenesis protein n=1 Tax=Sulfurimonas gotlandica (strain DSM 19862 / JCM 16533 / GD1) TaxID=929558 RepID=B6BJH2_SULGG|nr:lipopolysaccharide transport periplasmic protein LptA [Sulfurimonas gotlandica]EDZ62648.1 cell envelope biogenesis protein YhbN [Sulfurimonas gotlandica GD1]EHP31218.1 putative cell envelope biogenesis protein [Sulfurimonas gotlandica GD1]